MTELSRAPVVWINVTTSVGWTRPPVGIVRVERALAEHLQSVLGTDACRLCVWKDDRFVEWVPAVATTTAVAEDRALDVILPRSASFELARPYVLRALRRFGRAESAVPDQDRVALSIPTRGQPGMHPVRGDFIVSAGLDWDNRYTERFFELSNKHGLRIITCCYDLIPVLFPQYCVGEVAQRFTEYFIQLSWGSEAVLCISKQTQRDYTALCRELGAPPRRTVVIPLGDNIPSGEGVIGVQVESLVRQRFILFVSTIERRKNHEVLYRAYHLLARRGLRDKLPLLVFVGMPGWGIGDLLKDIELDPVTKGLIVQLHHVSDAELNHLYKHAAFCVYPSLYEGWGLPVGEALAMGKAVISSAEGSLPEVGEELVRYAPPWDVYAWASAIQEWIEQPDLVALMELRASENYRPRQWSDTAAVIVDLVRDLTRAGDSTAGISLRPGYDMSTATGTHVGPAMHSGNQPGLMLFGPHCAMPAGSYQVVLHATVSDASEAAFVLDVATRGGTQVHRAKQLRLQGPCTNERIEALSFTLDRDVDDLEIRCTAGNSAPLAIEAVDIRPGPAGVAARPAAAVTAAALSSKAE